MFSKRIHSLIIFAVMFGFAFSLSVTTHFFLFSRDFGHDAGIFSYIGYAITQGKVLYTEAWDNKGPLLYFINALGVLINYRYGIYFLELITLLSSEYFLYKTANLFLPRGVSLSCAIISMMSLTATLEGGNLSEEYSLPFTILAFYYIAKFFFNDFKLKKYEMLIVGMCISAVLLLRMNILAFLSCAVLGVIVVLIKNKDFKTLGSVSLFAILGFVLFTAPFVIYLLSTGSFLYCVKTVYLGVLGSFSSIPLGGRIGNINTMVLELSPSGALLIIILFVFFFLVHLLPNKTERNKPASLKTLGWISFFGLIATLLANSISGAHHSHYFICFVPVMIIPTVWLAEGVLNYLKTVTLKGILSKYFKPAACFFLVVFISFFCLINQALKTYEAIHEAITSKELTRAEKVTTCIIENSDPTDTIQVIGDKTAVTSYYSSKRMAASNYFYYANGRFSDEAKTQFASKIIEDVQNNPPKLIMFDTEAKCDDNEANKLEDFKKHCEHLDEWQDFLNENYVLRETDFGYEIYLHK